MPRAGAISDLEPIENGKLTFIPCFFRIECVDRMYKINVRESEFKPEKRFINCVVVTSEH